MLFYHIPKGLQISHLAYADDCVIFCNGTKDSVLKIKHFLKHYESCSGHKINLEKSAFLSGKRANLNVLTECLGMAKMDFPLTS